MKTNKKLGSTLLTQDQEEAVRNAVINDILSRSDNHGEGLSKFASDTAFRVTHITQMILGSNEVVKEIVKEDKKKHAK